MRKMEISHSSDKRRSSQKVSRYITSLCRHHHRWQKKVFDFPTFAIHLASTRCVSLFTQVYWQDFFSYCAQEKEEATTSRMKSSVVCFELHWKCKSVRSKEKAKMKIKVWNPCHFYAWCSSVHMAKQRRAEWSFFTDVPIKKLCECKYGQCWHINLSFMFTLEALKVSLFLWIFFLLSFLLPVVFSLWQIAVGNWKIFVSDGMFLWNICFRLRPPFYVVVITGKCGTLNAINHGRR